MYAKTRGTVQRGGVKINSRSLTVVRKNSTRKLTVYVLSRCIGLVSPAPGICIEKKLKNNNKNIKFHRVGIIFFQIVSLDADYSNFFFLESLVVSLIGLAVC